MKTDFAQLNARIQTVDTEINVLQRTRTLKASEAFSALHDIPQEKLEIAAKIVPDIRIVMGYTKEQLFKNENGEEAMVDKVITELTSYVENRLTYFESLL